MAGEPWLDFKQNTPAPAPTPTAAAPESDAPWNDFHAGAPAEPPATPQPDQPAAAPPTADEYTAHIREMLAQGKHSSEIRSYVKGVTGQDFSADDLKTLANYDDFHKKNPNVVSNVQVREQPQTSAAGAAWRGLRSAALLNWDDELDAAAGALGNKVGTLLGMNNSTATLREIYDQIKAEKQGEKDADARDHPTAQIAGEIPGAVLSLGLGAGGRGAQAANWLARAGIRAAEGAGLGAVAGAGGAQDGHRLDGAEEGALIGGAAGTVLPPLASKAAGVATGLVRRIPFVGDAATRAVNALATRAPQQADDIAAEVARRRAAGFDPALADVVDEQGAGVVRDASTRGAARSRAQSFYDQRREDLPGRVQTIAREVGPTGTATDDMVAGVNRRRGALADEQFEAVRHDPVNVSDSMLDVLGTGEGQSAINAAIRAEKPGPDRDALLKLKTWARDPNTPAVEAEPLPAGFDRMGPSAQTQMRQQLGLRDAIPAGRKEAPPVTVGMMQKVSKGLLDAAEVSGRSGANDRAAVLRNMGRHLRDSTSGQSDGYATALSNYAEQSGLSRGAEAGEKVLTGNTDDYVGATRDLSRVPVSVPDIDETTGTLIRDPRTGAPAMQSGPSPNEVARASAARTISNRAGDGPRAALQVADSLGRSQNAGRRLATLTDDTTAARIAERSRIAGDEVRRAGYIAPNTGSQTFARGQDSAMGDLIDFGMNAATGGKLGIVRSVGRFLSRNKLSEVDGDHLVELATDPTRTDEALDLLRQHGVQTAKADRIVRSIARYGAVGSTTSAEQGSGPAQTPRSLPQVYFRR